MFQSAFSLLSPESIATASPYELVENCFFVSYILVDPVDGSPVDFQR